MSIVGDDRNKCNALNLWKESIRADVNSRECPYENIPWNYMVYIYHVMPCYFMVLYNIMVILWYSVATCFKTP